MTDDDISTAGAAPGKTISLGVAETNALRVKLGLKPLREDGAPADEEGTSANEAKAVANLKQYREEKDKEARSKEMKAKLLQSREARKLKKAYEGTGLGDTWSEDVDNIGNFLSAMTALKKKKDLAVQRYDEEEEETLKSVPAPTAPQAVGSYTSADIAGMKVDHDLSSFETGTTQILTLKDENILEAGEEGDGGPHLQSADVAYAERAKHALEVKRRGTKYNPYADEDHEGGLKAPGQKKNMLAKYDQVIDEAKASSSFTLDQAGGLQKSKEAEAVAERLRAETADIERREIAEFYTKDEAVTFARKTTKRKKRSQRGKVVDAGDADAAKTAEQEALEAAMRGSADVDADADADHGSRSRKRARPLVRAPKLVAAPVEGSIVASTLKARKTAAKTMVKAPLVLEDEGDEEYTLEERQEELVRGVAGEEEEEDDLAQMLTRTKQRSETYKRLTEEQEEALGNPTDNDDSDDDGGASAGAGAGAVMEISTTDGFFRGIAREPSRSMPTKTKEEVAEGEQAMDVDGDGDDAGAEAAEPKADLDASAPGKEASASATADTTSDVISEPVASRGMAAAWSVAVSRGIVKKAKVHEKKGTLKAIADSVGTHKDRGAAGTKDDRYKASNPLNIEGYTPVAKLSYKDEFGNEQTAKEAWVALNHVFHGNGEKRNVREKIMRKHEREKKRERMMQHDTPTNMVASVTALRQASGKAHVVLDGSSAGVQLHHTLKVSTASQKKKKQTPK